MTCKNLLVSVANKEGNEDYFYIHDGLGSVADIVDASQSSDKSYEFEAFGSEYST